MPRRTQHDLLVEDSKAFLSRSVGTNRRTNPNERRRAIRKHRFKKELSRIARTPVFFEEDRFGHVWKQHRAWTIEKNAFDYDSFAQHYEKVVKKLLTRELKSMNGDGASMKVMPVISYVIGATRTAESREQYAALLSEGYAQPTWRTNSVHPERPQYLGVNTGELIYQEHWEVRSQLDLEGLEGLAIHNERDVANYARCLVEGMTTQILRTEASNAEFVRGNWLDLKISKFYSYAGGAARVQLPEYIKNKKAVINIDNKDERCMEYCLLAALHHKETDGTHLVRVSTWNPWIGTLDFGKLSFPIACTGDAMATIEQLNGIAINVMIFASPDMAMTAANYRKNILTIYRTKTGKPMDEQIDILYHRGHYMWIKNYQRFMNTDGDHKFFCKTCCMSFKSRKHLEKHCESCDVDNPTITEMPYEGSVDKFTNWPNMYRNPVIIYADKEAFNRRVAPRCRALTSICASVSKDLLAKNPDATFKDFRLAINEAIKGCKHDKIPTQWLKDCVRGHQVVEIYVYNPQKAPKDVVSEQTAASYRIRIVTDVPISLPATHQFVDTGNGESLSQNFVSTMKKYEACIRHEVFDRDEPMLPLTEEQEQAHEASTQCPICQRCYGEFYTRFNREKKKQESFTLLKCHDHSHITGQYRMDLCTECNLQIGKRESMNRCIPVVFHNLEGYDAHHLIQEFAENDMSRNSLTVIPNNSEKFKTITWSHLPDDISVDDYDELLREMHAKSTDKERKAELKKMLTTCKIRFIDSASILEPGSLDSLLKDLPDDAKHFMRQNAMQDGVFKPDLWEHVKSKGHFPYEWFDEPSKLLQRSLPTIEEWHSTLNRSYINQTEYDAIQNVWNRFRMASFKDWHDLYLAIDVDGLADKFEHFRSMSMHAFGLDPAHYVSNPGLFKDAMLKHTREKLELHSDIDMYNLIEANIRGGMSIVTERHCVANNKYMGDAYDAARPSKFNLYNDCTALYGWGMKQYLPQRAYTWLDTHTTSYWVNLVNHMDSNQHRLQSELFETRFAQFREAHKRDKFPKDWGLKTNQKMSRVAGKSFEEAERDVSYARYARAENPEPGSTMYLFKQFVTSDWHICEGERAGLFLEVDMHMPKHLHDKFAQFPLAPKNEVIEYAELSKQSRKDLGRGKYMEQRKLCATLKPLTKYLVHSLNLKLYLDLGMKVTKVHRVIGFMEKQWMKPFVECCEERRRHATSDAEKDFWKLAVNANFGKTMENVRKRCTPLKFIHDERTFLKWSRRPTFTGDVHRYSDTLVSIRTLKPKIRLDRPIAVGFAVLDISKVRMYDFYYNTVQRHFCKDGDWSRVRVGFGDTDSLYFHIRTDDLYEDLATPALCQEFDFTNYDRTHVLWEKIRRNLDGATDEGDRRIFEGALACANNKVAGKFKDEDGGKIAQEGLFLKPKMNCKKVYEDLGHTKLQYLEDGMPMELHVPKNISQTCKGVKRAVRHTVKLDMYRDVLLHGATAPRIRIPSLMSKQHQIYMIDRKKRSINPFDSKRYWLNAVESVPFGHYSISDWEEPRTEEEHASQLRMLAETNLRLRKQEIILERIDDAPMARLREIQKRRQEEKVSTVTAATVPNILELRKKRPHGMLLSMEELRSLRRNS